MSTYKNGQIPAHLLVRRGNHLLTAGTWAKWDAFVADVKQRHGVTLRITDGVGVMVGTGAYRDYRMQCAVDDHYTALGLPNRAATPGSSSHGGEFKGRDALAVDVTNYWAIPQAELFAAARRAGFTPGYFDGKDGRPLEPWHLIDFDPYREDYDMALDADDKKWMLANLGGNAIWNKHEFQAFETDKDWGMPKESAGMRLRRVTDRAGRSLTIDRQNRTELAALSAAVEALAKANGADPAAILKAVKDAVAKAMSGLKITLTAG